MNRKKSVLATAFIVLTVFLSLGNSPAFAQMYQGSLTFNMGFPQGEFNDNLDKNGYGLTLNIATRMGHSPILLGLELGFLNYGRDKRYESLYNIPDITVKVVNRYNILQGHAFIRVQPLARGPIRPYLDFLAGINYLWTETSIEDDDWDEDDISSVNFDDVSFSYGVGGGIMIKFAGGRGGRYGRHTPEFFLDIRARYILGGNAQYLQEGSIEIDGQNVTYYYNESKTDLVTFNIGIGISF